MAPIKFEEHIKERLEERRIEPSAAGWERLSGQLQIQQGKKKSKRVLWMSIAASFIIGVGLTAIFLQKDTTATGPVVSTPEKTQKQEVIKENSEKPNVPALEQQEQIVQVETPKSTNTQKGEETKTTQKTNTARKQLPVMNNNFTQAVATGHSTQKSSAKETKQDDQTVSNPFKESPILKDIKLQKKSEALAQMEIKELVTDKEIEDLLSNAQRDIVSDKLMTTNNTTVDANALLLDVEAEVDPERFKDKIFKALKQEVGKAIDAVANRNN